MAEEQDDLSVVRFEVDEGIAWVYFNRPEKRNAMNPTMNRVMMDVLDELEFRDDVQVLVLTGEGDAWQAGMDLKEYFRETEAQGLRGVRKSQRESYGWFRRLRWYQKPTIAMVNGWCFGGGFGPLYACDLAICADEAKFGLSEINWGILPGGGVALLRCVPALDELKLDDPDEQVGVEIVHRALEEPMRLIVRNAGKEDSVIVQRIKQEESATLRTLKYLKKLLNDLYTVYIIWQTDESKPCTEVYLVESLLEVDEICHQYAPRYLTFEKRDFEPKYEVKVYYPGKQETFDCSGLLLNAMQIERNKVGNRLGRFFNRVLGK